MNFKFKLSRRLAGLKSAALFGLALLGACSMNDAPTGPLGKGQTKTDTTTSTPTTQPAATGHRGYFVTPGGSASGDGTSGKPWDLQTALNGGNGVLQAGDTVWMHGGTYTGFYVSSVAGAPGKPIVFRQYPGERATIDGYLRANGGDVAFWGFEIMRSTPNDRLPGVEARGPRQKFINLIVHDAAQQGITFWDEAVDAVVYGCLVYNNGTHENLDHGTYVHNMSGTKLIKDNVFFDNMAYGIHVYGMIPDGLQVNVHVIGNVSFNNGSISTVQGPKSNILVGGEYGDAGMQVVDNDTYYSTSAGHNLWIGFTGANQDILVQNNMAVGGATAMIVGRWSNATISGNTLVGADSVVDLRASSAGLHWSGNRVYHDPGASSWLTAGPDLVTAGPAQALAPWQSATGLGSGDQVSATAPTTTRVFVRANDYEGGRALIVVYNFGHQGSVSVDLSGIGLGRGARYEVRNVQNYFGTPVAAGTYDGGSVTLPMNGVTPPQPIGRSTPTPPRTGPDFDTFVVVPM